MLKPTYWSCHPCSQDRFGKRKTHNFPAQPSISKTFLQLTANSDLLAVAGGDAVDIWQHSQQFPGLEQQLEDVARVQLLLGEKLVREDFGNPSILH